jgi:hypothetical protein
MVSKTEKKDGTRKDKEREKEGKVGETKYVHNRGGTRL